MCPRLKLIISSSDNLMQVREAALTCLARGAMTTELGQVDGAIAFGINIQQKIMSDPFSDAAKDVLFSPNKTTDAAYWYLFGVW
jgi:hypothetical protein